jgi:uncharacterized damage-inducible protein DinB
MAIKDALLPEFDHEMATTRRVLERVPEDRKDWKPHTKSMSLAQLAGHLAEIPGYGLTTLGTDDFDIATAKYSPTRFESREQVLGIFDDLVRQTRAALEATDDEAFRRTWTFRNGAHVGFAAPKAGAFRTFFMNHLIHHRGQLTVYLRLLDVPLPSVYGPTADEQLFG